MLKNNIKREEFTPVNDIFLLETDSPVKNKESYDTTSTGIVISQASIVESRKTMGTIVKLGPKCPDKYKLGDKILFYPDAGLDIVFSDNENKHLLIGEEKFLGVIK